MSQLANCPQCNSAYTYVDGASFVCPECAHEWTAGEDNSGTENEAKIIKDSVGNILADGDSITVIKDLKIKGSSLIVKVGTKVKNIVAPSYALPNPKPATIPLSYQSAILLIYNNL